MEDAFGLEIGDYGVDGVDGGRMERGVEREGFA